MCNALQSCTTVLSQWPSMQYKTIQRQSATNCEKDRREAEAKRRRCNAFRLKPRRTKAEREGEACARLGRRELEDGVQYMHCMLYAPMLNTNGNYERLDDCVNYKSTTPIFKTTATVSQSHGCAMRPVKKQWSACLPTSQSSPDTHHVESQLVLAKLPLPTYHALTGQWNGLSQRFHLVPGPAQQAPWMHLGFSSGRLKAAFAKHDDEKSNLASLGSKADADAASFRELRVDDLGCILSPRA